MSRYIVLACEILYREISFCAAMADAVTDVVFLPKGLHDLGTEKMRRKLQDALDKIDTEKYEAVLFAYGLCNNGMLGLRAKLPMVFPKAHDCITLLMGSREKYAAYFRENPGTYYKSAGWLERECSPEGLEGGVMSQLGITGSYRDYAAEYDEETAAYLAEMLGGWVKNYRRLTFIDTKVGNGKGYEKTTRAQAEEMGLDFDRVDGDLRLLRNLLAGRWEKDFLVVPPGYTAIAAHNDEIIACKGL